MDGTPGSILVPEEEVEPGFLTLNELGKKDFLLLRCRILGFHQRG